MRTPETSASHRLPKTIGTTWLDMVMKRIENQIFIITALQLARGFFLEVPPLAAAVGNP